MAASLGSDSFPTAIAATAADSALAPAINKLPKPNEARETANKLSPSCRDTNQHLQEPPPKKIRVDERREKPKKLVNSSGVGGDGSGKDKLKQSNSWSYSPAKGSSNHSVPTLHGGSNSQPPNTHKVLKQSDFYLHKSPSKQSRKPSKDKHSVKNCDDERKKKHKLLQNASGTGNNIISNNDISRFNHAPAAKRENGDVAMPCKGRPLITMYLRLKPTLTL